MTAARSRFAPLAALALFPALLLVASGLLQSATGHEVIVYPDLLRHPALVLGGLGVALIVAAASALSLHVRPEAERLAVTLHVRRQPAALAVLGTGVVLGAVIALYLVVETLAHAA